MDPMRAVAFLAEVVEGRAGASPEALVDHLRRALEEFSREHGPSVVIPLQVSGRSPECGGALLDLSAAYVLSRSLAETFFPFSVRSAATWGDLPDPIAGRAEADPLDGPAFETAALLLYRARKENRLLLVQGITPDVDRLANVLLLLLHREMEAWTERQCEAVRLYRRLERQETVAQELGVSQQAVSSALGAAGWRDLAEAEAALRDVFSRPPGRR